MMVISCRIRTQSPVTDSVLSGRAGDRLGAGRQSSRAPQWPWMASADKRTDATRLNPKALTVRDLADEDAGRQRMAPSGRKAGDRDRTGNIQLGRRLLKPHNRLQKQSLCLYTPPSDQLGAVLSASRDRKWQHSIYICNGYLFATTQRVLDRPSGRIRRLRCGRTPFPQSHCLFHEGRCRQIGQGASRLSQFITIA